VREVEFRDVAFRYPGARRPAVDGLSFSLRRGETVALVGENGAGKTTVTRLLAGVLVPERGEVRFDDIDLRDLAPEFLQREIGLLPQVPSRFEATAAENIAFGDWQRLLDDPEEVARIARDLGLDGLLASLPRGAETPLGRIIGEHDPSGGQWQQLGIARAFAHGGSVLLLDEPSTRVPSPSCSSGCAASPATAPRCSSRTASPPSRSPTASSC
jgi:ABC-type multidrug transport system fused ATPase/permease subunit